MKFNLISIRICLLLALICLPLTALYAYDFEVDGVYYNFVNRHKKQVEVSHWEEQTAQWGVPKRVHHAPCACCSHDACATDHHHHHKETLAEQLLCDSLAVEREKTAYCGDVVIPEQVKYKGRKYTVIGLGDGSFYKRKQLTSVTLPATVRYIGKSCFESCFNLTSINLPASLDSICFAAFRTCKSLRTITLSDNIRYIDVYAFADCYEITSLHWPLALKSMPGNVVWACKKLKTIEMPHIEPPVIEQKGLKMDFRKITFIVSEEALPNYKENEQWSTKNLIVAE